MRIVKGLFNIILVFLLCLSIIAVFFIILFNKTLLNKEYILNIISKNDYVQRIDTDLKNGFEEYQYQSGFSSEVFENLYSENYIKEDIDSMINYIYDGTEITNHSSMVNEQIEQNINNYLKENNVTLSKKEQQNVDEFKKIIVNVYENKINIFTNYIDNIADVKSKVNNIINIIEKALIGFCIFILIVALLTNLKELSSFFCIVATSLLSSGIIFELINFVIQKYIDIKNVLLINQSLSDLIKGVIFDLLFKINRFGIVAILLGIIGIIISNYNRVKNK